MSRLCHPATMQNYMINFVCTSRCSWRLRNVRVTLQNPLVFLSLYLNLVELGERRREAASGI